MDRQTSGYYVTYSPGECRSPVVDTSGLIVVFSNDGVLSAIRPSGQKVFGATLEVGLGDPETGLEPTPLAGADVAVGTSLGKMNFVHGNDYSNTSELDIGTPIFASPVGVGNSA